MKKIAVYGGTFDPIHHGHLILAREALERLGFENVIFVPTAVSPFRESPVASAEMRLLMVRAAIEGEPRFVVDDCELRRPAPSYTIDTIEEIRAREGDAEIYYLLGEDNVPTLRNWHRFDELIKAVRFVVLIVGGGHQITLIQPCTAESIFLPRKSERGLPPASRFAISYHRRSKRLFATKNFTRSNRDNRGKVSQNVRRTRLEQKGRRDRRA